MSTLIGIGAHVNSNPVAVVSGVAVLDTGWLNLTTFTSIAPGTTAWTNPGNAAAFDAAYALCSGGGSGTDSERLKGVNLVGSVPGGATIVGIETQTWRAESSQQAIDAEVALVIGGVVSSTSVHTSTAFPIPGAYQTHGGPSELWGETPSAADVNGATFGFVFRATGVAAFGSAVIDHMQMKIYYT